MNSARRILLVNYEYPPLGGGGGIETRDLAEELAKTHTVHVLTTWFPGLAREEVCRGVSIHRVRVWGRAQLPTATLRSLLTFVPAALLRGIPVMRTLRPDVVNAHFAVPSGLPAVFLSRLFRVPLVLTFIGGDVYDPSKGVSPHRHASLKWVIRWIVQRSSALTAISQDTKERAMRYHGAPAAIEVIPLGLVPPVFQRPSRAERGWAPDTLHVVTVGRLVPRKGYEDLLRGFASLKERHAVLHIVGDGPCAQALEELCRTLGMAERVVFHGRVSEEEKFCLLSLADIYVSASHHEGFGICFLEAMCVGLPIVATDTGGQTDFLVAGKNAILIPPRRPEQITHALDWLWSDAALRQALAQQNQRDIQRYLIRATADRYEAVFNRVSRRKAIHDGHDRP